MDTVLCSAGAGSMKYYFNEEEFPLLPSEVKDTLRAICVGYAADVGGIIIFSFDEKGKLFIEALDPTDEIGSELIIRRMQRDFEELFTKLEDYRKGILAIRGEG